MFESFKNFLSLILVFIRVKAAPVADDTWFNSALQPLLCELPGAKQPEASRQLRWLLNRHYDEKLSKEATLETASQLLERMLRVAPAESESTRIVNQVLNRYRSLIVGSSPNQRSVVASLLIDQLSHESYSLETSIPKG